MKLVLIKRTKKKKTIQTNEFTIVMLYEIRFNVEKK